MNERIEELMSIICEGQNSIQREEVENHINNLQSKIDKAIELLEGFKINSKDVGNEWAVEICKLIIKKLKEDK